MPPVGSQLPGRARGAITISKLPSALARDLLAGEAVAIRRVGDEAPVEIVQRHGPEARRRRDAGQRHDAAPVERAPGSSAEAKNATPSPEPIGNSPLRAIAARA